MARCTSNRSQLCPKIKGYLAIFLYADLFNSSTNCFLYSLSGKLFRRKFLSLLKSIVTCGRGTLWHVKQDSLALARQPLVRHCSHNASTNTNYPPNNGLRSSRPSSRRPSERLSSPTAKNFNVSIIGRYNSGSNNTKANRAKFAVDRRHHQMSDETSLNIRRTSDEQVSGRFSSFDIESDSRQASSTAKIINSPPNSRTLKKYFLGKVRAFSSHGTASDKCRSVQQPAMVLVTENGQHKCETQLVHPKPETSDG